MDQRGLLSVKITKTPMSERHPRGTAYRRTRGLISTVGNFRGLILLVFASFLVPVSAYPDTTLNFPRAFSSVELVTTGFAVVNPTTEAAEVRLTLYSADGQELSVWTETVPGGGQFAKLGSELFSTDADSGWVQVSSAATGLQGFWLGGDFENFTDGAGSAPSAQNLTIPFVTVSLQSAWRIPGRWL